MGAVLSDAEVFGGSPGGAVLSDAEVFGQGQKKPKPLGAPEELSLIERLAAKLPDWMAGGSGGIRGNVVGRTMMGMADPGVAIVQGAANLLPDSTGIPQAVNQGVKSFEERYQEARRAAGSDGLDLARGVGNAIITAPIGAAGGGATTLLGAAARGAATGAATGVLNPVTEGDSYWLEKAKQAGVGAAAGGIAAPAMNALARIISPKASTDAGLKLLQSEGVNPTVGQALGGMANNLEQKATSLPIVGNMIAGARRGAQEDFNNAVLNRALAPIGQTVEGAGTEAVAATKGALSKAYDAALAKTPGVIFDTPEFNRDFGKIAMMADNLPEPLRKKFQTELGDTILNQMSPNGGMLPETIQKVQSRLRELAGSWKKAPDLLQRDLGDAFGELKGAIDREVARQSPDFASAKKLVDTGYATFAQARDAAGRAVNQGGVFTPGQFNAAVKAADRTAGRGATAAGTALNQDLGQAAQRILGNTVPDSGTAGRMWLGGAGLGAAGLVDPVTTGTVIGLGTVGYARPIQNALVALLTKRPDLAPQVAEWARLAGGPAASMAAIGASR